MQPNIAMNFA